MTSKFIQGPTGFFLSFPIKKLKDGTYWDIAYPTNTETRPIIEQAILAQYEKMLADKGRSQMTKA